MADQTITPEIREILENSTIAGNSLVLPSQLDPKMYKKVNAVLVFAGGKWNTKAKAHIFAGDPNEKLSEILNTGVAVDEKKKYQAFYTPPELADEIALMANISGQDVLEPSAGEGALADACIKFGANSVSCIEINPDSVEKLKDKGYSSICADFLSQESDKKYDRIVMNPPFSKNQDIKHVEHALKWLSSDGMLVSILSPNTNRPKLTKLLEGRDYDLNQIDSGAFKESGTNIATSVLILRNHE